MGKINHDVSTADLTWNVFLVCFFFILLRSLYVFSLFFTLYLFRFFLNLMTRRRVNIH